MNTARIMRLAEVMHRTGLSRSSIYLRIAQGAFPSQIALGGRAVGWIETEVSAWIEDMIAQGRNEKSYGDAK